MRGEPANPANLHAAQSRHLFCTANIRSNVIRFGLLGLALGTTWGLATLGPFAILIWLPALALTIHGRLVLATLTIALSPPPVYFVQATADYIRGDAVLIEAGPAASINHNLDPDLRCYRVTTGGMHMGDEWVKAWPNNGAVRLMSAFFGPMANTYQGAYPTQVEAERLFAASPSVLIEPILLLADRLELPDRTITLQPGVGSAIFAGNNSALEIDWEAVHPRLITAWDHQIVSATASIWQEQCLLIRVERKLPIDDQTKPSTVDLISMQLADSDVEYVHTTLTLIDVDTGKPFAVYAGVAPASPPDLAIHAQPW